MPFQTQLPTKLFSAQEVREIDRLAIEEHGIDGFDLMQRAARFSFHALMKKWPNAQNLIVLCGAGNNAGDGYIVAGLAKKHGLNAHIYVVSDPDKLRGDAKKAYAYSQTEDVRIADFQSLNNELPPESVIVDALLGTGINKAVQGAFKEAIEFCNNASHPVFAIDIPSGLSADTGSVLGCAVEADATATFIGLKLGQFTGRGRHYCGELFFDQLDVPDEVVGLVPESCSRLHLPDLLASLPTRAQDAHKGHFGHVLLIGGDHGFGGAIAMAAEATARMGAGLTTVATQADNVSTILTRTPEVMAKAVASSGDLKPLLEKATTIVIGPGLGQSAWSQHMLFTALHSEVPTVIDADALNILCHHPEWLASKRDNIVFTPHPGEAARMLEVSNQTIQENRQQAIQGLLDKWGGTFLLKGSGSLIQEQNTKLRLCPYGNPGMATGGMGDVLSGILGGLIAQNLDLGFAVDLGVCIHAKSADEQVNTHGERGLLASDLIPSARALLNRRQAGSD